MTDAVRALYAQSAQAPTPILVLRPEQLASAIDGLSPEQRSWVDGLGFRAREGQWCRLPNASGAAGPVWVGLGERGNWGIAALPARLPVGVYRLQDDPSIDLPTRAALARNWGLGGYRFMRYRAVPAGAAGRATWPQLLIPDGIDGEALMREVAAVFRVRDLVNTPAEHMGPDELIDEVLQLAQRHGAEARSWRGAELLSENFPAIHAVGRASHREPGIVHLRWGRPDAPRIAIVGKGVCFDTGGLNLKATDGMRAMKKDMGGAAHALALAEWIMDANWPVRLTLTIPAVDNAVSGNAYRPGDVLATRAGVTVEIGNTDAEGRVVLADALVLAAEDEPELMIDFATLTGAARVALGPDLPPVFANDAALSQAIVDGGLQVDDPVWPMPLHPGYRAWLDSPIADIGNDAGSRFAGAITAALFLERFVKPGLAWAHLDTYAWSDRERPGRPLGGEALGLRAVYAMLHARYAGSTGV